ncbi:MarR family transcriptional regulator [Paraburkholderia xenovorans]|uniref:MarR family winged helix-turn-helix transcriptional regulator n=1 Tax=Paraburkholderia xenovorans TaxID=36873 RepID=UPI0038B99B24
MRELGFAISQIPVLVTLRKAGALSQAELARLSEVEQSSMAQLLNRMERDGLVERVADPSDRRSRLISLTPAASEQLSAGKAVMDAASRRALAGFSAEEKEQLGSLLLRVNANLESD